MRRFGSSRRAKKKAAKTATPRKEELVVNGDKVSLASYDDLFGVKANSDAVDWSALEDDLASEPSRKSTATNRSSESKKSGRSGSSRLSWRGSSSGSNSAKRASGKSAKSAATSGAGSRRKPVKSYVAPDEHDDEEMLEEIDSLSVGSRMSHSEASFEEVFGRRALDDDELDTEFEFSNPTAWRDNSATKEAVYDVLSKGGSTMQMARKLFLLEQLNQPAPPSEAPNYWTRPGVFGKPRRKKKNKGFYEIPGGSGAGGEDGVVPELFYSLTDIVDAAPQLGLDWPVRVDVLTDTARLLGKLHQANFVHGTLRADNVLLDDGLHVHLRAVKTIGPLSKADVRGEGRENKMHLDVLGMGVLILELATGLTLSHLECPKLRSAIKMEEKQNFDALEALQEEVDAELRALLSSDQLSTPASLVELCVQCCAPIRMNRPAGDDIIGWLQDLREDLQDPGTPARSEVARGVLDARVLELEGASLYDMRGVEVAEHDGDEDGYETDDSFQPPPDAEARGLTFDSEGRGQGSGSSGGSKGPPPVAPPRAPANKLQAFLTAVGDAPHIHSGGTSPASVSGDKPRPRSMMLPTGLKSMFADDESGGSGDGGGGDTLDKPKKLLRRRSLDRGYYYAKGRLSNKDKPAVKQLVSKANITKFKEAFTEKQKVVSMKPIDPEKLAQRLDKQEILGSDEVLAIIKRADKALRAEPNLIQLSTSQSGNVTIVGDIHGQYYDLRNLLRLGGEPGKAKGKNKKTTYLFLGDYIDRGDWGAEVLLYLFALKAKYPAHVWLLRGNHEARSVSAFFGFKEECEKKYGLTVYNRCAEAFQAMPIAATVETPAGKFLCLHGGISPNVTSLDQFIEFDRFDEPAMSGFLCDVLWSDPVKDSHEDGQDQSLSDFLSIDFLPNPQRGCSFRYGFRALVSFLAVNGLVGIVRAHEVQEEGYLYHFQDLSGGAKADTTAQVTPPVITVFSAPNYCGRYGNKAAYIRIHNKPPGRKVKRGMGVRPIQLLEPVQFTAVPHPEPLQFENEQERQTLRIETTCPYMPTTFNSFIKKAIELGEEEAARSLLYEPDRERGGSIGLLAGKVPPPPPALPPRRSEPQAEPGGAKAGDQGAQDEKEEQSDADNDTASKAGGAKKNSNWKAVQLLGFDGGATELDPKKKGAKAKKSKKKNKKANKKYNEAAASDGINEMNPMVVQDKMKEAQHKLNPDKLHLPDTVRLQNGSGRRPSLIRNNSGSGKGSGLGGGKDAENNDAVSFSTNELVALQMLFLFIDHKNKGYITLDDLVQWSAEEGAAVPKSEAELCINYVDVDFDGRIGFEDYLVFAAKNKERWLVSQYASVRGTIEKMKLGARSGSGSGSDLMVR